MSSLLLFHFAATLFMTGVIWFVQIVHYPLYDRVGEELFARYERDHSRLTTWVVAPPMLVELLTGVALLWVKPHVAPAWLLWTGAVLIVLIWLSTALLQIPAHGRLSAGFDSAAYRRLVASNWGRTVAWSIRSVLWTWNLMKL